MKNYSFRLLTMLMALLSSCNNESQFDTKESELQRINESIDGNIEKANNGGLNPDDFKDDDNENYLFQDTTSK